MATERKFLRFEGNPLTHLLDNYFSVSRANSLVRTADLNCFHFVRSISAANLKDGTVLPTWIYWDLPVLRDISWEGEGVSYEKSKWYTHLWDMTSMTICPQCEKEFSSPKIAFQLGQKPAGGTFEYAICSCPNCYKCFGVIALPL